MTAGASITRRAAIQRPQSVALPKTIAGLDMWFPADQIAPAADATNVPAWADASGAGNNGDGTGGTIPKYYNAVVNGKPIVRWVAGDSFYASPASASISSQTIFVVCNPASVSSSIHALVGASGPGGAAFLITASGGLQLQIQGVTVLASSAASAVAAGAWQVLTASMSSGANKLYVNGTEVASTAGTFTTSAQTVTLGSQFVSNVFSGDMADVIRYNTALSDSDRIALHTYLGSKYAITMGGS